VSPDDTLPIYQATVQHTVDIATIEVSEDSRRKGHAKRFIALVEELAKRYNRVVYVECVNNEILAEYLKRQDYKQTTNDSTCYYKESKDL